MIPDLIRSCILNKKFKMRGNGESIRDYIYIDDIVHVYKLLSKKLYLNPKKYSGEIFNAGFENKTVLELAETVKKIIGRDVELKLTPTNDNRSYHISSKKIKKIIGFEPKKTISDAVNDLKLGFKKDLLPNSLTDEKYFNIKKMQSLNLK